MTILNDDEKPSLNELTHHGVKGMHWGQRKQQDSAGSLPIHASYTKGQRQNDQRSYGSRGVSRINEKLHAGVNLKDAREAEGARRIKQYNAVAGGIVAARLLQVYGPTLLTVAKMGVATAAHNNRMKAGEAAVRGLGSAAMKVPYAKLVRGAYKITTLK